MTPALALDHDDTQDLDIISPPLTALNVTLPSNETAEGSELETAELATSQS